MNKTKNIIFISSILILCVLAFVLFKISPTNNKTHYSQQPETIYENTDNLAEFSDGLVNPDSVTEYELDEFNMGLASKSIYYADINRDGANDRITKNFISTGNAHSYYAYKIELNHNGKYIDITPDGFQTINGAMCDLQQIQFKFKPSFKIIMIYRQLGDTWNDATLAEKKVFTLKNNTLVSTGTVKMRPVCDVKELF